MYNKIEQKVPDNIRYLSEWKDYRLPDGHCIVDKEICGCGYTEYCIRLDNPYDTILCSPRIVLLENKMEKHQGEPNIFYFSNEGLKKVYQETVDRKDKDLTAHNKKYMSYLAGVVRNHVLMCRSSGLPIRILCTYDSFHTIYNIQMFRGVKMFKQLMELEANIHTFDDHADMFNNKGMKL